MAKKKNKFFSTKTWIFGLMGLFCIINLLLSLYIAEQKSHNDQVSIDECFLGDGGCYTVQTSSYATTFGIVNPVYGFIFFGLGILLFGTLKVNAIWPFIRKEYLPHIFDIIQFFLVLGTLFSLWLLYVQFFILQTTCVYCLWVDSIMIGMLILFSIFKKKLL